MLGFFGANGSGKTNILKALTCCLHWIQDSFSDPVILDSSWFHQESVSKFELIYENEDGEIFEYHLHFSLDKILEEILHSKTKKKDIFSRIWDQETQEYRISSFEEDNPLKVIPFRAAKRSSSFISYLRQFSIEVIKIPVEYYLNVWLMGKRSFQEYEHGIMQSLYNDKEILAAIEQELNNIGVGPGKITINENKNLVQFPFGNLAVTGTYSIDGKGYDLPYQFESGGTRAFIVHLARILPILQNGGIAIIDEIEAELHPQLVEYLVRLFKDPQRNKHKAQLIFSSHLHMFLNELEAERVYLVEKNQGASEAYRLDEFEDIEDGDDLRRKYLAGAFGAIPNL